MFYANSLNEAQADLVAHAYYRSGKNPRKMAMALGVEQFDIDLIRHPLVKRAITKLAERMRKVYTLDDHLERLQEIRDQAMEDGNLRIALAAELSVGKAAGLYEKITEPEAIATEDASQLTTEEIRAKLARMETSTVLLPGGNPVQDYVPEGDLDG